MGTRDPEWRPAAALLILAPAPEADCARSCQGPGYEHCPGAPRLTASSATAPWYIRAQARSPYHSLPDCLMRRLVWALFLSFPITARKWDTLAQLGRSGSRGSGAPTAARCSAAPAGSRRLGGLSPGGPSASGPVPARSSGTDPLPEIPRASSCWYSGAFACMASAPASASNCSGRPFPFMSGLPSCCD